MCEHSKQPPRLSESKGGAPGGSWIIHSPSLTSYKFWPGTLGRTANHAMVIARLIDGQKVDRGMHNFLVPLRSMNDHSLLPGVKTGDIGPKIGYNVMDNGFASFDNVVIPRRNMAMRFAHVDERGNYQRKTVSDAAQRISYITMMQVRAYICNEAGKNLAMACTIAIRYSAVRRQGFADDHAKSELQILDYTQQQHRLFPLLAASYCFFFTGKRLLERLFALEKRLVTNQKVHKTEVTDIHASSSGLKSFTTTVTADGIEDCRKACGGHGFLMCSGLPELLTTYLQNPTVEGDNQMLPQQVVKVLLKLVQAVQAGKDLSEYESCDSKLLIPSLQSILQSRKETCTVTSLTDMMDLKTHIMSALRHRAAHLLIQVAQQIQREVSGGKKYQEAWNKSLVLMARVSRAYSQLLLIRNFVEGIDQEEDGGSIGLTEANVLRDLARIFALYWMERELGDFLEDNYMTGRQASLIHAGVLLLLEKIRPNAVALTDARDFSDFRLKSALGRFDGDVYPAIMEAAMRDPLNQEDIGPGYKEHLKRLIVGGVGAFAGTSSRL
jgi:acyl-CoA oxidase